MPSIQPIPSIQSILSMPSITSVPLGHLHPPQPNPSTPIVPHRPPALHQSPIPTIFRSPHVPALRTSPNREIREIRGEKCTQLLPPTHFSRSSKYLQNFINSCPEIFYVYFVNQIPLVSQSHLDINRQPNRGRFAQASSPVASHSVKRVPLVPQREPSRRVQRVGLHI